LCLGILVWPGCQPNQSSPDSSSNRQEDHQSPEAAHPTNRQRPAGPTLAGFSVGMTRSSDDASLPPATMSPTRESDFEASAHGFPVLRDLNGRKLADGEFTQRLEGGRLHVRLSYEFSSPRRIQEDGVFRQEPRLAQEKWSWTELVDGKICRHFDVDFGTGQATAQQLDEGGLRQWSKHLKLDPSRAFAGFGVALAIKCLREQLLRGQNARLDAIGFTPKPHVVPVEISYCGLDQMSIDSRILRGDRFLIHPQIPAMVRPFVKVPDTRIWLINPPPTGFLRWEGPLAESSDRLVRVDLLSGEPSGPAEPVRRVSKQTPGLGVRPSCCRSRRTVCISPQYNESVDL
jgi:hypothetical protein